MLTSTGQFYFLTLAVDHNLNHCNFKDWVWLIQVDSDNSKHHTPSIQSVRNAQSASVFFVNGQTTDLTATIVKFEKIRCARMSKLF